MFLGEGELGAEPCRPLLTLTNKEDDGRGEAFPCTLWLSSRGQDKQTLKGLSAGMHGDQYLHWACHCAFLALPPLTLPKSSALLARGAVGGTVNSFTTGYRSLWSEWVDGCV